MRHILLLAFAGSLLAQPVHVYSEFERIDPFGKVLEVDRAEMPREILSPALARKAWTTFQIVIDLADQPYTLFIAQNPDRFATVKLYRPVFVRVGKTWVPDRLEPVSVAPNGEVALIAPRVPGQTALVYWLDVWLRPDAPVRRWRLEVQLNMNGHWTIYPMEPRVQAARASAESGLPALPAATAPSSAAALAVMRGFVCGTESAGGERQPLTLRALVRRNALQDRSLARALERTMGRQRVIEGMLGSIGLKDREQWCRVPTSPPELGSEWYLRVRDFLYRSATQFGERLGQTPKSPK